MSSQENVKGLIELLQKQFSGKWIFGEPVKIGEKEIIPITEVTVEVSGTDEEKEKESNYQFKAYGDPVGFIFEKDGDVRFVSFNNPQASESSESSKKKTGQTQNESQRKDLNLERLLDELYHKIHKSISSFFENRPRREENDCDEDRYERNSRYDDYYDRDRNRR